MKYTSRLLLPHALIATAYVAANAGLLPEPAYWTVFVLAHLALPIWCTLASRSAPLLRTFIVGPGSLISVYLGYIAWALWDLRDAPGHDAWLARLVLFVSLGVVGVYVFYCLLVFGVAARWRRHRSRPGAPSDSDPP